MENHTSFTSSIEDYCRMANINGANFSTATNADHAIAMSFIFGVLSVSFFRTGTPATIIS